MISKPMNRMAMALWILSYAALHAAEPPEGQVQQLALEVKMLKLELFRLQMQQIAMMAAPVQQEVQTVRARLVRLDAAERAAKERLAVAAQQWKENQLTPEERREMQELEMGSGGDPARMAAEREILLRREAELTQQVQSQRQAWNNISAAAAVLESDLRNTINHRN